MSADVFFQKYHLSDLEEKIGYSFQVKQNLIEALTHSAFANAHPKLKLQNNERLEFLGDQVLGLIISRKLYLTYPEMNEGDLSKIRSALVSRKILSEVAQDIDLRKHLILHKNEEKHSNYKLRTVLSNAMEAVIGAIYLDSEGFNNFNLVEEPVLRLFESRISSPSECLSGDAKSELNELMQKIEPAQHGYVTVSEEGPDHSKIYKVNFVIDGKIYGSGTAGQKKNAEKAAAVEALLKLKKK